MLDEQLRRLCLQLTRADECVSKSSGLNAWQHVYTTSLFLSYRAAVESSSSRHEPLADKASTSWVSTKTPPVDLNT
jgi:hypothetical protein